MGHRKFGLIFLFFYVFASPCLPLPKPKRSSQFSRFITNQGQHQLHDSLLLYNPWPRLCCSFGSHAKAWGSHGTSAPRCQGRAMRREPARGPSWQRVFTSPAPASGTVGWEEASVSAEFAYSYQVCSLVINIVDLKFFLGKRVVLPKLLQHCACTYPPDYCLHWHSTVSLSLAWELMLAWSWRSVDTMRTAAIKVMLQLTENLHSPPHGQSSWQSCLSTTRTAFPLRGTGRVPVLSIQHQIFCT